MSTDNNYNVLVDNINEKQWNEYFLQFNDASIAQTWTFGEVRWGKEQLSHIILKRDDDIVAICQVIIRKLPLLANGIAFIHGGPLWRKNSKPVDLTIFNRMILAIKKEYGIKRNLLIRITPYEIEGMNNLNELLIRNGYKLNESLPKYKTLRISLDLPIDEIKKRLRRTWRSHLNRAERMNIKIINGTDNNLYEIFLRLAVEMTERKKYTPRINFYTFQEIQNKLPSFLKMTIFIGEHGDKAVSSIICSTIGETCTYMLGATGDAGLDLFSSNLLHWHCIKYLKKIGKLWYDLGGINPDEHKGLFQYKRGLAGRDSQIVSFIGTYEFNSAYLNLIIITVVDNLIHIKVKIISFFKFFKFFAFFNRSKRTYE